MTLGKGRAVAIGDRDIAMLADRLTVHPADLEAISMVESRGFGWYRDGRIKILFEKHQFYKRLPASKRVEAVRLELARKHWIKPANGGYKEQATATNRYDILEAAIDLDEDAAYQSISVGKFQIMGFNSAICGFLSAKHMFVNFVDSEAHQLVGFANFLKGNHLVDNIRACDFETVEEVYNGGGLNGAYARKMRTESDALRAGKWKNYKPGIYNETAVAPAQIPEKAAPVTPVPAVKPQAKPQIIAIVPTKDAKVPPIKPGSALAAAAAVVVAGAMGLWAYFFGG